MPLYESLEFPSSKYTFTVKGYAGSQAEPFCKTKGIKFEAIGQAEEMDETLKKLTYSFPNTHSGFGYSSGYRMAYDPFERIWGYPCVYAESLWEDQLKWQGNCFGMSASTALMNRAETGIAHTSFKGNAQLVSDLTPNDYSAQYAMNVLSFIEMFQVSQFTSSVQNTLNDNRVEGSCVCRDLFLWRRRYPGRGRADIYMAAGLRGIHDREHRSPERGMSPKRPLPWQQESGCVPAHAGRSRRKRSRS